MLFSKPAKNDSMMTNLVMGQTDVVGMLAYAIYSQFKDEWRREFKKTFGREPSAQETNIFDIGERTERRKMTYRFLGRCPRHGHLWRNAWRGERRLRPARLPGRGETRGSLWVQAPQA